MRSITLSLSAIAEYDAAYHWYSEQSQLAATRFREAVQIGLEQITTAPESWPVYDEQHRFHGIAKYPYTLIYHFDEATIFITAIAHHAREPGYWQK